MIVLYRVSLYNLKKNHVDAVNAKVNFIPHWAIKAQYNINTVSICFQVFSG